MDEETTFDASVAGPDGIAAVTVTGMGGAPETVRAIREALEASSDLEITE